MTNTIEIICECGTSIERSREAILNNINGAIRCHHCGELYRPQNILSKERFGIADFTEGKA